MAGDWGLLQIKAQDTNVGHPLSGASVRITPHNGGGEPGITIDGLITDSSGQTEAVDLTAPPVEYSMDEYIDRQPYSEYDVTVIADGFEEKTIEAVQILPETQSFQTVTLERRVIATPAVESILIPPHTLWGTFPPKIPEPEVKPLPPALGYVVLPEVVVPEFMIVHDGVPSNAAAQNYWVPFQDYIKNVASCEIYANWPEETIRANVLAILSFTLNRVYTEWYRGKGYEFTITNSTAFDHAFSYGRNIFAEISHVVDEIFTTFITRPNIRQPLLTQYCDGRRSQCPEWMTQWGSKALGDQGYSDIEILKSFYGYDIFLMQAKQVQGVPRSFGGEVLQMGSTGDAVRTIQEQLNAISNNYPAIFKVRVDGVFDDETRASVETFQQVFGLPANGMVDFSTWYRISDIYVAVTRIAELR